MSLSLAALALNAGRKSSVSFEKRARRVFAAKLADVAALNPGKLARRAHQRGIALENRRDHSGDYFHIPR